MIISHAIPISAGDQALQNALDKLAICKTLSNRRGSIDLLENMDLDLAFLGNDEKEDSDGFFGHHTDFNDEDGISLSMDAIRHLRKSSIDSNSGFRGFDDLLTGSNNRKSLMPGVAGRSASISSSSSMFGNTHADQEDALLQSFHTNIFDLQGHVEMSAYENMAKSLSVTKPSQSSKASSAKKTHGSHYMQHINVLKSDIARSGNSGGASGSSSSSSGVGPRPLDGMQQSLGTPNMGQSLLLSNIGDGTSQYSENEAATPIVPFHPMVWVKRAETEDGKLYIGAYSPEQRKCRIERFIEKRSRRVWTKKVKYDVRKNFADSRLRVKGRFVKKEDEEIMRELMTI
jgi:hypothetical protein